MVALKEAQDWLKDRMTNIEWIDLKLRTLNEEGFYILSDEVITPLSEEEQKWNLELTAKEDAAQKAKAEKGGEREPSSAASSSMLKRARQ